MNFNSRVQLDFRRSISHFHSCIKSVLTGVFFFPIEFNLKPNTQYMSCRSLNGKSQVRDPEHRDRKENAVR